MDKQHHNARQSRTRTLIQAGGLLQKAGLFEAFAIQPGDNLQAPEMRIHAECLLGFLHHSLNTQKAFEEANLSDWRRRGKDLLQLKR